MVQHDLPSVGRVHTGPVRTCVGCRRRVLAAELLRVVARVHGSDGAQPPGFAVVPDPGRRLPGRGAWVHPTTDCLGLAARRRAFGRALKVSGLPDTTALDQLVGSLVENPRATRGEHPAADTNSDIEL
ncbi:MAG: YlxR family protein [Rhodococcus sp.]|uniref:YlxR family protein n=1 Tax=Rhodococcus TaxID=1827 RepID=UPI00169E7240|nr:MULTISPECIES: YlxR family protein [Rhodococcus]NLV78436.1 YlxR family protein [Rhodococcus sp. (in: high G+C Gram-positive bacteria)]